MDLGLRDKVVVITGGASGVGAAISKAALREGARVAVLSRVTPETERFLAQLGPESERVIFLPLELAEADQCAAAIRAVTDAWHGIDALVNNAGRNDRVGLASGTGSAEAFMESLRQNLLHYYVVAQCALPWLKQSRGSIVNISSKVAVTGQGGTSAYAAAKGAQLGLTREWAADLLVDGIRVNAVVPAEVSTPAYREWVSGFASPEEKLSSIVERIPLEQRMTTPEEIAAAVVFLLSPTQSGHTTGQQIFVDGGYTHLDRAVTR